jgi:transposase
MRPYGSPKTLERRRRKAAALLESGLTLEAVARRVGASVSSVCRWRQTLNEGGEAALAPKPAPGRPRKLKEAQRQRLLEFLLQGALAYGFANDLWTLKRIARVIRKEFGVKYHPNHVWRLLQACNWSCQVPERRALQRDEQAIAHWNRYRWPHIKKGRSTWGPSGLSG